MNCGVSYRNIGTQTKSNFNVSVNSHEGLNAGIFKVLQRKGITVLFALRIKTLCLHLIFRPSRRRCQVERCSLAMAV